MKKKLKVAWICPLDYSRFKDRLSFYDKPADVIAPWITLLIKIFEEHREEAELHVISSPPRLFKDQMIVENGIHYYFVSDKLPLVHRKTPFLLKKFTHYYHARIKVRKLIRDIGPDVIEFHGAEHDLAWAFFDIDLPKILNPQFFVNNYYRFNPSKYLEYWMKVEEKIYRKSRNFGYRNEHMKREILALNPKANLYKYQYPIKKPLVSAKDFPVKEYDLVFTARLIKSKGIEDLLQAIHEVKKELPDLRANIIGQCNPGYFEELKIMVRDLGVENNIKFTGFLSTQEAMFEEVAKSKLSVLPTHFDLIPGSILEAMYIGTPVVAYASGGIPELNTDVETVRLVSTGNVELLAKEMLILLKDEVQRQNLSRAALNYVTKHFGNEVIFDAMLSAYRSVIKE